MFPLEDACISFDPQVTEIIKRLKSKNKDSDMRQKKSTTKSQKKVNKSMNKTGRRSQKWFSIIQAAEEVFAKKGFHEATISEIAKRAKVSEATIYEYFSSKEDLLFSIPVEVTEQFMKENEKILRYIDGAENKLRALIHRRIELFSTNENYAKITTMILKTNRNFLDTEGYKLVQESSRCWTSVLEEGIESGEFRAGIDIYLIRAMIWGTIEHLVIRKSLLGKPENISTLFDDIVDVILKGIKVNDKAQQVNYHFVLKEKNKEE